MSYESGPWQEGFGTPELFSLKTAATVQRPIGGVKRILDKQNRFSALVEDEDDARVWENLLPRYESLNSACISELEDKVS